MAIEKIDKNYPGISGIVIFDKLLEGLKEVASTYGLTLDVDRSTLKGRVYRSGLDVKFTIKDGELSATLDFSFIVPGTIRSQVKSELITRLNKLC